MYYTYTKMKEAVKSASKSQVDNALDIADKNIEKMKKLQTFNLSNFSRRSYFDSDGLENYLIFQPIYNTFTRPAGDTETIIAWKSPPTALGISLPPKLKWIHYSK